MALPSSGAISLNQMHVEAGGGSGTACTINDSDIRALIGKGSGATMSFSEWYGASAFSIYESGNNGYMSSSLSGGVYTLTSANGGVHNSTARTYIYASGSGTVRVTGYVSSEGNFDFARIWINSTQVWNQSGCGYSFDNNYGLSNGHYVRMDYYKDYSVNSCSDYAQFTVRKV